MPTIVAFHPKTFAAVMETGRGKFRYLEFPYDIENRFDCDSTQLMHMKYYGGMAEFSMYFDKLARALEFIRDMAFRKQWLIEGASDPVNLVRRYKGLKKEALSNMISKAEEHLEIDQEIACWSLLSLLKHPSVEDTPALLQRATAIWEKYHDQMRGAERARQLAVLVKHLIYVSAITVRPADVALYTRPLHWMASTKLLSEMDLFRYAYVVGEWDRKEAIWALTRFIKKVPKVAVGYNNRGNHYANQGEFELAYADFTKAMTLERKYTSALYNRGHACDQLGRYDLAIADYTLLIEWTPKKSYGYNGRAYTYFRVGRYEEAMADMEIVMRLDPKSACNLATMAELYGVLGNEELFFEFLEKALRADPKEFKLLNERTLERYGQAPRFRALQTKYEIR